MRLALALCGACGVPPLEKLSQLTKLDHEIELWWVSDLCYDPDTVVKMVVSGAEYVIVLGASNPEDREVIAEAAQGAGLHPLNLDFIDVPIPAMAAECEAILRAALAAVHDFRRVDERHVKPTTRVRGATTRRAFVHGMRPMYAISIPRVLADQCRAASGCDLCVPACPVSALEILGRAAWIRAAECTGCNQCVSACPTAAIVNPYWDFARLRTRVRTWAETTAIRPRRLVLACPPSAVASWRTLSRSKRPAVLFQEIPCLRSLRAREYLDLLSSGIDQIVCTKEPRSCESIQSCSAPQPAEIAAVAELPEFDERIVEVEPSSLARALQRPLLPSVRSRAGGPFGSLHEALQWFTGSGDRHLPLRGRGAGFVEIHADRCTGCLVCRDRCPTGAIRVSSESRQLRIDFRHEACDACGLCESECPERALTLHREIRFELMGSDVTAFTDDWVPCRRCGTRVAPRSMIARVSARIGTPGDFLELCPDCRLRAGKI